MERTHLPVHPLIARRFSPRAFSDRELTTAELETLFEAARLAPSSFNEQPWRFVIVRRGGAGHAGMLSAMIASNQVWAQKAPLVVLNLVRGSLERNGITNPHAWHDLGLALGQLNIQAEAMGLGVRHLAGIDPEKARHAMQVPEEFDVVSMMVIGFPGDPNDLPENLKERELKRSPRKPLSELIHFGKFGATTPDPGV
jgi:nitroreductase